MITQEELPEDLKIFIQDVVLNPKQYELTVDKTNKLFNLHNTYVNPDAPAYNKSCPKCVKDTLKTVKDFYSGKIK